MSDNTESARESRVGELSVGQPNGIRETVSSHPTVIHYVHQVLPRLAGYTIRTHYLARALSHMGYSVSVLQGLANSTREENRSVTETCRVLDGVTYLTAPYQIYHGGLASFIPLQFRYARGIHRTLFSLALQRGARWLEHEMVRIDLVHAHSPFSNALHGLAIANHLRVPFVYEVRGYWGLSDAPDAAQPALLKTQVSRDVQLARTANHVVAICGGIADQLVQAGISAKKITIIPNGVEVARFRPQPRDVDMVDRLGLHDRFIFGYITNVRRMEGIQTVIEAWPTVLRQVPNAVFLLVGDGDYLEPLKEMVMRCGLEREIIFTGRVPHDDVKSYYSLLDAFVIPRIPLLESNLVTPLKPLEAMAMGIPVVASNVAALREQIKDGETGLLFTAGDPSSLARACVALASTSSLRDSLRATARSWVVQERDWDSVARGYEYVYQSLA